MSTLTSGLASLPLIPVEALGSLVEKRGAQIGLVSIMWVNNETGVVQPVQAIGEICRRHGVRFHTDATQLVGKMPLDVSALPIDLLSFAAHKFHGPKGVGALYVRRGVRVQAQVIGGPHERQRRGGTENTAAIIGFGVAARLAGQWLASAEAADAGRDRDALEQGLLKRVGGVTVNGAGAPRMWDTTNVAFADLDAEPILLMLSERGVCASAGAACASGSLEASLVLRAMGVPQTAAEGSIRFGLSRETTRAEIDQALDIIVDVIERLRAIHSPI